MREQHFFSFFLKKIFVRKPILKKKKQISHLRLIFQNYLCSGRKECTAQPYRHMYYKRKGSSLGGASHNGEHLISSNEPHQGITFQVKLPYNDVTNPFGENSRQTKLVLDMSYKEEVLTGSSKLFPGIISTKNQSIVFQKNKTHVYYIIDSVKSKASGYYTLGI